MARHSAAQTYTVAVGPTTAAHFNKLILPLRPCACWRVDDMRFEFDSSFVLPEIDEELRLLAHLRQAHPGSPITIFAHADPVGNDDYNKALSGRRATALYALLTRSTDQWEHLYQQPLGKDRWGRAALQVMLDELAVASPNDSADGPGNNDSDDTESEEESINWRRVYWASLSEDAESAPEDTESATEDGDDAVPKEDQANDPEQDNQEHAAGFQADQVAKYEADATLRKMLYLAYMDRLAGPNLKLTDQDFLGRGVDGRGKADYQGCGEFNPVKLFSLAEQQEYAAARSKVERNLDNASNRRVVIYLFEPGAEVDPNRWPCPCADEGTAGCQARFWSDAAQRRANGAERREYAATHDTFACRFYDRLAQESPCEAAAEPMHIRLYDLESNFIARAPFQLLPEGQAARRGRANAAGFLSTRVAAGIEQARIEWGFPAAPGERPILVFSDDIFLHLDGDPETLSARQLTNLGYTDGAPLADKVFSFQSDYRERYGLEVTGQLDEPTRQAIQEVHDGLADNLRTGEGENANG